MPNTRQGWARAAALLLGAAFGPVTGTDEPVALDPVTVTATLAPRTTLEVPFAVSVLTRAQIEDLAMHSAPDLFTHLTGVYIQKTNLGGGSPFIRGLTGKQALILVDGVRLNNSFYRSGPHQYLNTLDPELIERIEVVRGARSVIYGSDALGGVINIVTRPPDGRSRVAGLSLLDSAADGGAAALRGAHGFGALDFSGGAAFKQLDDLEAGGSAGTQNPSGYSEFSGDLAVAGALGGGRLTLQQQYLRQRDVPKTSEVTLGSSQQFDYEPQVRALTVLDYRREQAGAFDELRLNLSLNVMEEGENVVARATPDQETRERTRVTTPGALLHATRQLGEHRVTWGADAYRDEYDVRKERIDHGTGEVSAQKPGTPDGARHDSAGVFVQDEWQNGPGRLVGGLRYARVDTEGAVDGQRLALSAQQLTGSLHGAWSAAPGWALIGGVEQGFRAPNMEDFFARVDFVGTVPNTALQPEESLGWELGVKHAGDAIRGELVGFLTDYENLIDRVDIGGGVRQNRNINRARIQGLELSLEGDVAADWSAGLTSTWTHGRDGGSGAPLRRIPPWFGAVWLRVQPSPRMWSELELRSADKQDRLSAGDMADPRIGPNGTPGYAVWNLNLGWRPLPAHQLVLTAENLGDHAWKTHGSGIYQPGLSARLAWRWSLAL